MFALAVLSLALAAEDPDPAERAARVSDANGELLLLPAGSDDWVSFERNRPVLLGDTLFTQGDARSEIDLGTARLWLDYASGVAFTRFDADDIGAALQQGNLRFDKRSRSDTLVFAAGKNVTVVVAGEARGRIDRTNEGVTVSIYDGRASIKVGELSYDLQEGENFFLRGSSFRVNDDLRSSDSFDDWVSVRSVPQGESDRYVAPTVAGRSDLDRYGDWETTADYGAVWYPNSVAVGWQPYRYGHWVATLGYGWTWVDDAPWGYAPFHYGRWVNVGSRWGWCPGQRVTHVAYAPALVVFLSTLANIITWAPLGYGQVYQPGFHCSSRYNVSMHRPWSSTRVVDVVRVGAYATSVSSEHFGSSHGIHHDLVRPGSLPNRVVDHPPVPHFARAFQADPMASLVRPPPRLSPSVASGSPSFQRTPIRAAPRMDSPAPQFQHPERHDIPQSLPRPASEAPRFARPGQGSLTVITPPPRQLAPPPQLWNPTRPPQYERPRFVPPTPQAPTPHYERPRVDSPNVPSVSVPHYAPGQQIMPAPRLAPSYVPPAPPRFQPAPIRVQPQPSTRLQPITPVPRLAQPVPAAPTRVRVLPVFRR